MPEITKNNNYSIKFHKEINSNYLTDENFAEMLEEQGEQSKVTGKENSIVQGVVTNTNKDYVLLDVGLKSEGQVPLKEFTSSQGEPVSVNVGDVVNVHLTKMEGYNGSVVLSRENAAKYELWDQLNSAYEKQENVTGSIIHKIKSGYIVNLGLIAAFLPNSHVEKRSDPTPQVLNKPMEFRILRMDKAQGNIVVSRRVIVDETLAQARKDFLANLSEGQVLQGKVKSITNYGVFVGLFESKEIGEIDGLLHVQDMSWSRINHPSAIYSCGDSIEVKIIKIDKERSRISLGRKQLTESPWDNLEEKYPNGLKVKGVVSGIESYGVFVKLNDGIEGLVYSSELSWTNEKLSLTTGDTVEAVVLNVDSEKNRMSLSIRQCTENPWVNFTKDFPLGSTVKCKVKNINSHSGINVDFVDYNNSVSGFIYNRDLSWKDNRNQVLKCYNVGDVIDAKLLRVNEIKGGIFLGVKQLKYDPFEEFLSTVKQGDELRCVVNKIEDYGIYVAIQDNVDRFVERDNLTDISSLSIGENIKVRVMKVGAYELVLTDKERSEE